MRIRIGSVGAGILLALGGALAPAASSGGQALPEGEGRDEMIAACSACHSVSNILNPHKEFTAEEWEFYLYDMVARGAPVYEEDLEAIRKYLVENYAAD